MSCRFSSNTPSIKTQLSKDMNNAHSSILAFLATAAVCTSAATAFAAPQPESGTQLATNSAAVSPGHYQSSDEPTTRSYLVKNSMQHLILLADRDLDALPKVRRAGNVKEVLYKGAKLEVDATLVKHGDTTIVLDRYMPSDDSDD